MAGVRVERNVTLHGIYCHMYRITIKCKLWQIKNTENKDKTTSDSMQTTTSFICCFFYVNQGNYRYIYIFIRKVDTHIQSLKELTMSCCSLAEVIKFKVFSAPLHSTQSFLSPMNVMKNIWRLFSFHYFKKRSPLLRQRLPCSCSLS